MTDKIDYATAKFVLDTIQESLNGSGGSVSWAVIGRAQELCKTKIKEKKK